MSDAELSTAIVNSRGYYPAFLSDRFTGWVTNGDNAFFLLQEMVDGECYVELECEKGREDLLVGGSDAYIQASSTTQLQRFIAEAYLIWKQQQ